MIFFLLNIRIRMWPHIYHRLNCLLTLPRVFSSIRPSYLLACLTVHLRAHNQTIYIPVPLFRQLIKHSFHLPNLPPPPPHLSSKPPPPPLTTLLIKWSPSRRSATLSVPVALPPSSPSAPPPLPTASCKLITLTTTSASPTVNT